MLSLLKLVGWLVAHSPERLLHGLAVLLGDVIFFCLPRRRRLILSNLHHAFPDRTAAWHRGIGRQSCRRLIETGLLSLATPFLGVDRYRHIIAGAPPLIAAYAEHHADPAATLICSPHIAYWEAQTAMSLVIPTPFPEFGTIFRPLDHPAANALVTASRERYGMKLLSRKEGFAEALRILRRRGLVGVLFDQNAGLQGALTTLFGRVCSTTELPGLMAEKFKARVYGIYAVRRAFWRVEISVQRIESDGTSAGVTIALNRWLEALLRGDDNLCASWLWAHDRWRNQDQPARRLRLEAKRDLLAAELSARRLPAHPRRTRVWVRMPNWLGDVVMTLPLLRALRASRPDAELGVVAAAQFLPLLRDLRVADQFHPLPARGLGYFRSFRRLRREFPDVWLLFTHSQRGDLEAWLAGARQRFGLRRPGHPRPLLTHAYTVPGEFDETSHHQLELWENFLRHFGLAGPIDRTPFRLSNPLPQTDLVPGGPTAPKAGKPPRSLAHGESAARPGRSRALHDPDPIAAPRMDPAPASARFVGLIPGSENNPEKRWPPAHWRSLIASLPDEHFILFGTANDAPSASAIATGFDPGRVENAAGRTDLSAFARRLQSCRLLVTNDSGGMHLANALGVPVLALFGPTNPVRTGPVFSLPATLSSPPIVRILQPPGCPPAGGGSLAELLPAAVASAVREARGAPVLRS